MGFVKFVLMTGSVFCMLSMATSTHAQDATSSEPEATEDAAETAEADDVGFASGSFIAVPIPVNDPTFGTGLVLGVGYLFKSDEDSDTSFLGGGLFGTDEGSRAAGIGGGLSLDGNRYNFSFILGAADLNYDLFVLGTPVEIEQEGAAFQGQFRYGFSEHFSAGVSARYLESKIAGAGGVALPPEIVDLTDTSIATLGLVAKWDTRDDSFYPTKGTNVDFSVTRSSVDGGRDIEYTSARLSLDQLWTLDSQSVLAARVAACGIEDEAPFFDSCLLGAELRGFSLFQFYGSRMLTAQIEYRRRLSGRFGMVAFAGMGDVQRNISSIDSGVRYAGGLGLRYRVSKDFALDVALDATVNDQDENYIYFYVGQSF